MSRLWRLLALLPLALVWAGVGALLALDASKTLHVWPWPFMVAGALLALATGHLPHTPIQFTSFYRWASQNNSINLFSLKCCNGFCHS